MKKIMLKSVISLVLVFTLLVSTVANASESKKVEVVDVNTARVVIDNKKIRTVSVEDENQNILMTLDKINNTVKITTSDKNGNIISDQITDLNKAIKDNESMEVIDDQKEVSNMISAIVANTVSTRASVISFQNTYSNYEYTRYSDNSYTLRRPDDSSPITNTVSMALSVTQSNRASNEINIYRAQVNAINSKESEVLAMLAVSVLITVLMAFLSGGTIAGGLLIAGISGNSAGGIACIQLGNLCADANEFYYDVKRAAGY